MIYNYLTRYLVYLLICSLIAVCCLTGCAQHDYKTEADKQVYNILDKKWQDDFGSKANYKISDTNALPDDIKIEKAVPASGTLTLKDAVAIATAHNRSYQLEKENLYLKTLQLTTARHVFENQFFGGASADYTKIKGGDNTSTEAHLGFNRLLATGAQITSRVALAWTRILTNGASNGTLGTILDVSVTQPLLKGSDPSIVQENLTQAERDALYQIRTFNRFRQTFVVSIISQYYLALQQFDYLKNAQSNYETLTDVYDQAEKLANAGRLPRFELDRVYQDKLRAQDICIQAQKLHQMSLDKFKLELALPPTENLQLDDSELENLKAIAMAKPEFSETCAIDTALALRLDLINSADVVIDAERKVLVAADALRPGLNLIAGTNLSSVNHDTFGKKMNDSVTAGLQFDLAIDRLNERNAFRAAQITLTQKHREYEQAADIIKLQLRQAYTDLAEASQRYHVQLESLSIAQKRFQNTLLLLQYGRANTRDVLDAQDDCFKAQNIATQTMVDYATAALNFYRDAGVLQIRPDGMWHR
jgi:outer membrane protein TolC